MADSIIDFDEMPITLDLAPIKVGADYSFTLEILDDNEVAQATTGWTMQIKGRANGTNGPELFNLTVGSGIVHTPSVGRFVITIPAATTLTLTANRVYWDCKITDNNAAITFPFEGIWEVRQTVTK